MDAQELIELLEDHDKVKLKSVEELKKLATEFPYSQPIQLLYAIRLSQSSEYLFNRQLGRTAILTNDRTVLFDMFERESEPDISAQASAGEKPAAVEEPEEIIPSKPVEQASVESAEVNQSENTDSATEVAKIQVDQNLTPQEKIKIILEENRRLREQYKTGTSGDKEIDQRISGIREKLAEIKSKGSSEPLESAEAPGAEIEASSRPAEAAPAPAIPETGPEELAFEIEDDDSASPGSEEEEDYQLEEEALLEEHSEDPPQKFVDQVEAGKGHQDPVFTIEETADAEARYHSLREMRDEQHSFSEWMRRLQDEPREKPEPVTPLRPKPESEVKNKLELLDTFVQKLPQLKQQHREVSTPKKDWSLSHELSREESSLVTETLARVYVKQKHFDKAIKAYEILRLKYPEKSGFFADRIAEIKKLSNS